MSNFKSDYSLHKIKKIKTSGTSIDMYITPRYMEHYVNNEYEKYSVDIVQNLIKKNQTIVDIGAHYGYYSLAINKVSKNKIIAIEAVKENFEILNKNFKLNNIRNYKLINAAASDQDGEKDFIISEASDSSGFYANPQAGIKKIVPIKTVNVAKLLKNEKIGLIKIDVEGYELEILKNIFSLKNLINTNLLIEFNPKCQIMAGHQPEEMLNLIKEFNYDIYLIIDNPNQLKEPVLNSNIALYKITNNINVWKEIINDQASVNLICIPIKKSKLITFFSHSSQLGGAERSMLELIYGLKKEGIFSHVVLPNNGPIINELSKNKIPYDIISTNWWANTFKQSPEEIKTNNIRSFENIINYLPKLSLINPDLIYTNTIVYPWGSFVANHLNRPHLWHIREYGDLDHNLIFDLEYKNTIQYIEANSDQIITNSKSVSNHISQFLSTKKPTVIYNYIDIPPQLVKEKIKSPFTNSQSLKIIVCGSIHEGKNQFEAIQLIKELNKSPLHTELLIIGTISNNQYFNNLQLYINKNNLSKQIHFIDFTKNPYPYIIHSDIVLIPSKNEAFGRIAIEGILLKRPVVASASGGITEIIHNGTNGFTYEPGDIKKLAIIITKLNNKQLRHRISTKAINQIKTINNKKSYVPKIAKIIKNTTKTSSKKLTNKNIYINIIKTLTCLNIKNNSLIQEIQARETLQEEINLETQKIDNLKTDLQKIRSAKFFKLWRLYCKIIGK